VTTDLAEAEQVARRAKAAADLAAVNLEQAQANMDRAMRDWHLAAAQVQRLKEENI
jgi:hypothetical protein